MATTDYCAIAGVPVPSLARIAREGRAGTYGLLLVALLERGGPATLAEVAEQFEAGGIAPAAKALRALRACRPARPPIYRDGELYCLDPHDAGVEGWALRLGILPPLLDIPESALSRGPAERQGALAELAARMDSWARERGRRVTELARMRHALIHAFPADAPQVAVIVDLDRGEEIYCDPVDRGAVADLLGEYDVWAGVAIRAQLRALGLAAGSRKLAELAPPQKSVRLDGRTRRVTLAALIRSSCGIPRPLGDAQRMRRYLAQGERTALRRRMRRDARALYGYYRFARLHHGIRLHCAGQELWLVAPWVDPDEADLIDVLREAWRADLALEVAVGRAPGWTNPWRDAIPCRVLTPDGQELVLVDAEGRMVPDEQIQLIRPLVPIH